MLDTQNWLMMIIIGIVCLVAGLVLLNITFNIEGENIIDILAIVIAAIGGLLIILGIIFLALEHKPVSRK